MRISNQLAVILLTLLILSPFFISCGDRTLISNNPSVYNPSVLPGITLFSPTDGYASPDRRPEFRWQSTSTYAFTLAISTNSDMSNPYTNFSFASSNAGSYTPDFDIRSDVKVYWQVSGVSGTGTTSSPVYTIRAAYGTRELIISEVNWSGVRRDTGYYSQWKGDFVEIFNNTTDNINLGAFKLIHISSNGSITNTYTIPPNTFISSSNFFVIAQYTGMHSSDYFKVAYEYNNFSYWQPTAATNDVLLGDVQKRDPNFKLELRDSFDRLIDSVNAAPQLSGFDAFGSDGNPKASMERKKPFADGNVQASWGTATGQVNVTSAYSNTMATPGANNSIW